MVDELVASGVLVESVSTKPDYDAKFYRAEEPHEFRGLFQDIREESTLRLVLNTWGESSTGEILDDVYFRTEPMEHGVRNEVLDFGTVAEGNPSKYLRSSSGATQEEIAALKSHFRQQLQRIVSGASFQFTPPKYDDEFYEAIDKLETSRT